MNIKFTYKPKINLERFGYRVYLLLVENFPLTFYVGGAVRDSLLHRKTTDIDLATSALPEQVIDILSSNKIGYDDTTKRFGNVTAINKGLKIEITTFRKDQKSLDRYPKVKFVKSPKMDSQRRDFTVNSLYLSPKLRTILDYQEGLKDIKNKLIRFVGDPVLRIKEDPIRILRALRFAITLNFKLEKETAKGVKQYFYLQNFLTQNKKRGEINKIKSQKQKILLKKILSDKNMLDKYFI